MMKLLTLSSLFLLGVQSQEKVNLGLYHESL